MYDVSKHFGHVSTVNGAIGRDVYSLKAPLSITNPSYRSTICSCCGSLFTAVPSFFYRDRIDHTGRSTVHRMTSLGLRLFPGTITNEFPLDPGFESRDDIVLLDGSALTMLYYNTYKDGSLWPIVNKLVYSGGWQDDDEVKISLKPYTGPKLLFIYFGGVAEADHPVEFYQGRGYGDRTQSTAASLFYKDKFSVLLPSLEAGPPLFFILTNAQLPNFETHLEKYGLKKDVIYSKNAICNLNDQAYNNPRLNVRVLQRKV